MRWEKCHILITIGWIEWIESFWRRTIKRLFFDSIKREEIWIIHPLIKLLIMDSIILVICFMILLTHWMLVFCGFYSIKNYKPQYIKIIQTLWKSTNSYHKKIIHNQGSHLLTTSHSQILLQWTKTTNKVSYERIGFSVFKWKMEMR